MAQAEEKKQDSSEYLKDKAAAEFLNLSVFTLRNWRNAGTGPRFRRFGRSVRYSLTDLTEYADGRKV